MFYPGLFPAFRPLLDVLAAIDKFMIHETVHPLTMSRLEEAATVECMSDPSTHAHQRLQKDLIPFIFDCGGCDQKPCHGKSPMALLWAFATTLLAAHGR